MRYTIDPLYALRMLATREQKLDGRNDRAGQADPEPRVRSQSRESREGNDHDPRKAAGKNRSSASGYVKDSRTNLKYLEAKTLNLKLRVLKKVGSRDSAEYNGRTSCREGMKVKPINTDRDADTQSSKSKLKERIIRNCDTLPKRQHRGSQNVNPAIIVNPSILMVSAARIPITEFFKKSRTYLLT
jgi:hypothetical protein